MSRSVALLIATLIGLGGCGAPSATTTTPQPDTPSTLPVPATIELPAQPDCFAYQGTGDYADLVGYCVTGTQLVGVVRMCEELGSRPNEFLALATAPES